MAFSPRRPRVFVSRPLPEARLHRLTAVASVDVWPSGAPPTREELAAHLADAEGLLSMLTDRVDAWLLDRAPLLRVVSNMAVGFDNLDVAELTRRGVAVGNTPGVLTDATADLAFGLILAVARRIVESADAVRAGEWPRWDPQAYLGLELAGATLGIVGFGRIGEAVARRAAGFSMRVLATSRRTPPPAGVSFVELDTLLAESDVVSVHVALSEETHQMIGARQLALMKPTAILVNTARGAVVDQRALAAALASGTIAGAGLDVVEIEPIPHDDPLLTLANCVLVPHIGSATVKTRQAMADLAIDNLVAGILGEPLPHCVNPEVRRAV